MKRNDDFRKLLDDARNAPEKKPGELGGQPGVAGGPKKKSLGSKKFQQLMEQKAKEKEVGGDGAYRDRADERRKDNNEPLSEVAAMASVDIEMSKYLGGDLEHTHLVKGLDFALLNKVRGELEQKSVARGAGGASLGRQELLKTTKFSAGGLKRGGLSAAAAGSAGTHLAQLSVSSGGVATRTHMGKALAYFLARDSRDAVAAEARRRQAAGGLRGSQRTAQHENMERMGFEFNLAGEQFEFELPTTVSRAKVRLGAEDWDDDELVMAAMGEDGSSPALAQLQARAIAALAAHRSGKRAKHGGVSASQAVSAAADKLTGRPGAALREEDDIFTGAGAYDTSAVEEPAAKKKRSRWDAADAPAFPAALVTGGASYFSDLRAAVPSDAEPGQTPGDLSHIMVGIKGLAKAVDRMEARKEGRGAGALAEAAAAPGLGMGSAGAGYGEDHDFDFGGEE